MFIWLAQLFAQAAAFLILTVVVCRIIFRFGNGMNQSKATACMVKQATALGYRSWSRELSCAVGSQTEL